MILKRGGELRVKGRWRSVRYGGCGVEGKGDLFF
jgi:hypothetical protein